MDYHQVSMHTVIHTFIIIIIKFILSCRAGFDRAFELLKTNPRTGCQSVIVFATDGQDTDGEDVRCGPGNCRTF